MSMRLIILGPPGAGKGTQAARIAERLNVPAISTGDIFRSNIKNKTELGQRVEAILASGAYVPDEVTNEIVADRLTCDDATEGFLLELTVDEDAVVDRLLKRAAVEGRADDTEEVIRERQAIYRRETAPLAAFYADHGLLVQVDGMGEVDEVTDRVIASLPQH